MARKEMTITISADGRDKGKRYLLREWSAEKAEDWGVRALIAVARSGADIPAGVTEGSGMLGVAIMGLRSMANIDSREVTGLLNELMECVVILTDPKDDRVRRALGSGEDDIEEVATRFKLKAEVFTLHTGFSLAEVRTKLTSAVKSLVSSATSGSQTA